MLRTFILAFDYYPARDMCQANGRVGFIDVLAACATRAKRVDTKVGLVDLDFFDASKVRLQFFV